MQLSLATPSAPLESRPSSEFSDPGRESAFWVSLVFLCLGFATVGGARDDLLSLLLWRPISTFLAVISISYYGGCAWRRGKSLVLMAVVIIAAVAAHLIPLPPSVWSNLPGHHLLVRSFEVAGIGLSWQPLSIAPARTWNALFSLVAPFGMLVALLAMPERRHNTMLGVLLALGFLSGIIGMIQAIGPSNGILYFYRITNNGTAVGLFANRNHQAAVLATLIPMLAARLSLYRGRPDRLFFERSMVLAGSALALPLLLMTGSRMGIALGLAGVAIAYFWIYRSPQASGRSVGLRNDQRSRLVGLGVTLALVIVIALIAFRTPAIERLMQTDASSELRVRALPYEMTAISDYFPFGSGFGTFVEAYQIIEPDVLIASQYFNHAHSDVVELVLTGGLLGAFLLLATAVLFLAAAIRLWRRRKEDSASSHYSQQVLGRAGIGILAILALASLTDYPVRVPSIMLYATVMVVWAHRAISTNRKNFNDL